MVQRAMKFTPQALISAPRRSAGVPNPSGTKVLYTVSTYSFESHKKTSELRVLDAQTGDSHQLAKDDDISDLRWLDDDQFVCLQAEKDSTTSLFVASVSKAIKQPKLGENHYVAGKIDGPAGNLKVKKLNDDSVAVVISAEAYPDGSLYHPDRAKKTHSTGKLYTGLYVRHWDRYETKEVNALWYGKLSKEGDNGRYKLSKLTNATTSAGLECPIRPFGGTDTFDLTSDAIIFVTKDPDLNPALNTKCNLYMSYINSWEDDKAPTPQHIVIPGFEGAVSSPTFNHDGTQAAFLTMKKNGYESDKNQIFLLTRLVAKDLTPMRACSTNNEGAWDRSPNSVCFSADGQSLFLTAEDIGAGKLFVLSGDFSISKPRVLTKHGYVSDVRPLDSGLAFVSGSSLTDNSFYAMVDPKIEPNESTTPEVWNNSNTNHGAKFGLKREQVSSIWTPANNPKVTKEIQSIVIRPSNFSSDKKYPVAYIIHGGPQGSWADNWSTRWNLTLYAEQGYIVVAPNFTGSTGYGQHFTDSIRRNWGGDPYEDIVKVFNWVGENMKEADNDRAVALGASYGGYMVNWIQGHDLGRKLKAIVCHDGSTSFAGMLSTEELYFPLYDMGGTPWYDPGFKSTPGDNSASAQIQKNFGANTFADWRRWDPSEHFVNWSTPQLVIHSSKDYRLLIADGLAAFNVLQARGVDSQFLTFPDENHWVLKPENSLVWHKVVLNWINKYAGLPAFTEEDHHSDAFFGGIREDKEAVTEMPTQGKPES